MSHESKSQRNTHNDLPTLGRRGVLRAMMAGATLAAAGSALAATGCAEDEPSGGPDPGPGGPAVKRIDTHHHVLPPEVKKWMMDHHMLPPDSTEPWTNWNETEALEVMNRQWIQAGVVSMPAPSHIFSTEALAEEGIRVMNDALAALARRHPTRYGFFAYLPLRHVNFAVKEIGHALETLGADGFILMNHLGHRYLGDPTFEPIFAELNRRRAVFMTHPDFLPNDTAGAAEISPLIPGHIADFMLDTTRGALGMMLSGTLDKYPDITVILPHGGGFLPYIVERISHGHLQGEGLAPERVREYMNRFYYDTAAPMSRHMTPSLLASADPSHILYGSDYHQVLEPTVAEDVARFLADPSLDDRARTAISRDNALRILPQLARRLS